MGLRHHIEVMSAASLNLNALWIIISASSVTDSIVYLESLLDNIDPFIIPHFAVAWVVQNTGVCQANSWGSDGLASTSLLPLIPTFSLNFPPAFFVSQPRLPCGEFLKHQPAFQISLLLGCDMNCMLNLLLKHQHLAPSFNFSCSFRMLKWHQVSTLNFTLAWCDKYVLLEALITICFLNIF